MEPYAIKKADFVKSAGADGQYPPALPCEIAVVGRSNVGKSSLINTLAGRNRLARTSSSPGLTRLINYFLINGELYLVDLPGYGYAKTGKAERERWGGLMENYLSSGRVKHLFLLLDIRHTPSEDDRQMYRWLLYYGVPFTLIATKADKLPKSKRKAGANLVAKELGAPPYAIPFSAADGAGKDEILLRVGQILSDCTRRAETSPKVPEEDEKAPEGNNPSKL
jgi:GTP-binding protein